MTIEAIDLETIELFSECGHLMARTDDGERVSLVLMPEHDESEAE